MRIIPFRIKASEEEDNFSDVYAFLMEGSKKEAYEVEIDIDSLNDIGITDTRCTCPHFQFRAGGEKGQCKHIIECIKILNCFDIKTEFVQNANFSTGGTDCRQFHTKTFPIPEELKGKGFHIATMDATGVDKLTVKIGAHNLNNTSEQDGS